MASSTADSSSSGASSSGASNSPSAGGGTEATLVLDTASASQGQDRGGYRDEFISLVRKAIALSSYPGLR